MAWGADRLRDTSGYSFCIESLPETRGSVLIVPRFSPPAQGQRVTKPMPFALHQSLRLRDSAGQLSTEEMEMAEAQKHAFKSTPTPKHLHEPRPIEGLHQVSTPRRPEEIFEVRARATQPPDCTGK